MGKNTFHPIVFLREENADQFIGCIITKSKTETYQNNIAFLPDHFEKNDDNGDKFRTQFINSHFVKLNLIKKKDWGPYIKTGKLSPKGLQFIESHLKNADPTLWADYMKQ